MRHIAALLLLASGCSFGLGVRNTVVGERSCTRWPSRADLVTSAVAGVVTMVAVSGAVACANGGPSDAPPANPCESRELTAILYGGPALGVGVVALTSGLIGRWRPGDCEKEERDLHIARQIIGAGQRGDCDEVDRLEPNIATLDEDLRDQILAVPDVQICLNRDQTSPIVLPAAESQPDSLRPRDATRPSSVVRPSSMTCISTTNDPQRGWRSLISAKSNLDHRQWLVVPPTRGSTLSPLHPRNQ